MSNINTDTAQHWKSIGLLLSDADYTIDASELHCPMPLLKLKMCLKNAQPPQLIHLITTDPHSQHDINRFCQLKSHQVLDVLVNDSHFHFLILV